MILGWVIGFLVPIMVMMAPNWDTVVYSNIFLGFQQGICWSLCIFIMVDYAGPDHRGFAVGINETCGYVSIAVFNLVVPLLVDDDKAN